MSEDLKSPVFRSLWPDQAVWTPEFQILVHISNELALANWQRTDDASKKAPKNRPVPMLPPWVEDPSAKKTDRFGTARMTLAETDAWMRKVVPTWR